MGKLRDIFIKRVKQRQRELGMNDTALAEALGIAPSGVSNYLSESPEKARTPGLEVLARFAQALGVPAAYLVDDGRPFIRPEEIPAEHPIEECARRWAQETLRKSAEADAREGLKSIDEISAALEVEQSAAERARGGTSKAPRRK